MRACGRKHDVSAQERRSGGKNISSVVTDAESERNTKAEKGCYQAFGILEIYSRSIGAVSGYRRQLNHVSRETLVDAQKHPEKYPNLRVRVSGFSGSFVRMKKSIPDEIIARTVARP